MPKHWRRLGLRAKTILLLTLGLTIIFGSFSYITEKALTHSTDAALQEKLAEAKAAAASVDALIGLVSRQFANLARLAGMKENLQQQRDALSDAFEVLSIDTLWLLDTEGNTLWQSLSDATAVETRGPYRASALQSIQQRKQLVSQPPADGRGLATIAVVSEPLLDPDGELRGVVQGEVRLTRSGGALVSLPEIGPTSRTSIVTDDGEVVVSSVEGEDVFHEDHIDLLGPFLRDRQAGVKLHRSSGAGDHIVAFAPLTETRGGVIVEELRDPVLALGQRLRRTILVLASAVLVLATLASWLYLRSVVGPVLGLKRAAERIATGDLNEPIPVDRGDEIGDLAQAFETMRVRLLELHDRRLQWEQELEDRVKAQSTHLRELLGRVISAQESERKRIARELHDGATQLVSTLLLEIEGTARAVPPDATDARESALTAKKHALQALEEMRRVLADLRPPALDDLGLVAAVRDYAEERLGDARIKMDFKTVGRPPRLEESWETAVFRILQEAISNVAAHSSATSAAVSLSFQPNAASAVVKDDGKGFDLEAALKGASGVGIAGMLERAEILGGHLSILSTPGCGTEVSLEVPFDRR